jgi:hypothetical protein
MFEPHGLLCVEVTNDSQKVPAAAANVRAGDFDQAWVKSSPQSEWLSPIYDGICGRIAHRMLAISFTDRSEVEFSRIEEIVEREIQRLIDQVGEKRKYLLSEKWFEQRVPLFPRDSTNEPRGATGMSRPTK